MNTSTMSAQRHQRRPLPELRSSWGTGVVSSPKAEWARDLLAKVDEFGRLPSGWDGRNSPGIGGEVLAVARQLLVRAAASDEMPRPHVAPVPGGGVQVEWHLKGVELELEVLPSLEVSYLRTVGEAEDYGVVRVERMKAVGDLVQCLIR